MRLNSELGIGNAEWKPIPTSTFRTPHFLALAGFCLAVLLLPARAAGCPGCKEALIDPQEAPRKFNTARGYAASIGLMLAVPATLVGGMTVALMRASRRKKPSSLTG